MTTNIAGAAVGAVSSAGGSCRESAVALAHQSGHDPDTGIVISEPAAGGGGALKSLAQVSQRSCSGS